MSAGLSPTRDQDLYRGWLDEEVLFLVKKWEGTNVYCCRACRGADMRSFALKVYNQEKIAVPHAAMYQEGRVITNARPRARFGQEPVWPCRRFGAWAHHEFATLNLLHTAGADVPCPVRAASNAILIEFVAKAAIPPAASRRAASPAEREAIGAGAAHIEIMLCVTSYTRICPPTTCSLATPARHRSTSGVDARQNRHASRCSSAMLPTYVATSQPGRPTPSLAHSLKNMGPLSPAEL